MKPVGTDAVQRKKWPVHFPCFLCPTLICRQMRQLWITVMRIQLCEMRWNKHIIAMIRMYAGTICIFPIKENQQQQTEELQILSSEVRHMHSFAEIRLLGWCVFVIVCVCRCLSGCYNYSLAMSENAVIRML